MDNAIIPEQAPQPIDLFEILGVLWKNILAILLAAVLAGSAAFAYTVFRMSPTYKATAALYVNNTTVNLGSAKVSVSSSELSTSSNLVSAYLYILKSRTTLEEVISTAGMNLTPEALRSMISTKSVSNTSAFEVTVTSRNPEDAELLANTIAKVLPVRIADIVDGSSVRIVDYAIIPSSRSGPDYLGNTAKGLLAGLAAGCLWFVLLSMLDKRSQVLIQDADDLREMYPDIMVLTMVPDMRVSEKKNGYYSSYYYTDSQKKERRKHG